MIIYRVWWILVCVLKSTGSRALTKALHHCSTTVVHHHWHRYLQYENTVQKSQSVTHFFIICIQATRLSYNLLKWSSAIALLAFWRSFKVFLRTLAAFSLIFSPVFWPDHFESQLTLTYASFKYKAGASLKGYTSVVSTRNRQLGHFVTSNLSERHIICSYFFRCKILHSLSNWRQFSQSYMLKPGISLHNVKFVLKKIVETGPKKNCQT